MFVVLLLIDETSHASLVVAERALNSSTGCFQPSANCRQHCNPCSSQTGKEKAMQTVASMVLDGRTGSSDLGQPPFPLYTTFSLVAYNLLNQPASLPLPRSTWTSHNYCDSLPVVSSFPTFFAYLRFLLFLPIWRSQPQQPLDHGRTTGTIP